MVSSSDFMTVLEAATVLGYTAQHTRLLLREGKLKGDKRGRDWLVPREAVAEYTVQRRTLPLLPEPKKRRSPLKNWRLS